MISLDTQQWMWGMNGDRMFVYLPFINCLQRHYPKMNPYETCLPSAQADVCYYRMWNIP